MRSALKSKGMRPLRLALVLVALTLLGACHRVAYQSRLPRGGEVKEQQLNYWFWGLSGKHEVDLDALCPAGVASYRSEATAFGLWNFLTLGIFTPRTLYVECTGAGVRP